MTEETPAQGLGHPLQLLCLEAHTEQKEMGSLYPPLYWTAPTAPAVQTSVLPEAKKELLESFKQGTFLRLESSKISEAIILNCQILNLHIPEFHHIA